MTLAPLDLATIQAQLAASQGRHFWRSFEELAETDAFEEFLHREFPRQASEWLPTFSRRNFLKLMGASLAMGGLAACSSRPPETIVPYVQAPEETIPGLPLFFATAMQVGGYALGLLAQSQLGRPTKLEGNPDHPASLGATDAFAQASILTLYDPDRAKTVTQAGAAADWEGFLTDLLPHVEAQRASSGAGLRILTETVTSPTLYSQLQAVQATYPNAVWHQYEPLNRDPVYAGAALAFGEPVEPIYQLDKAEVIVSLDADLFHTSPGRVRYARDFADGRAQRTPADMQATRVQNRLYVVESMPTVTGSAADHRLPLAASRIEGFARALAVELGVLSDNGPEATDAELTKWITAVANDLQAHMGTSLVVAGDHQPALVHALAHALNDRLGNVGETVIYTTPVVANPADQMASLRDLVDAMNAGQVELLLILGGSPVYTAPADLDFAAALDQVKFRAQLSLYADETAARCHWHLPEAHYLESWSDGRAYDGTVTIQQPLIEPLYGGVSAHQLLDALVAEAGENGLPAARADHDIVKAYWIGQHGEADFTAFWETSLHDGVVADSALPATSVTLQPNFGEQATTTVAQEGIELNFRADATIWDGRFVNNGWLQELPKPLTKLTWENAALISPQTALTLGLTQGDLVELAYQGRTLQAPLWLMPGHAANAVTVTFGYGRSGVGHVAAPEGLPNGFNAYALRTADAPWFGSGLTLNKIGQGHAFATTQNHFSMEGRDLVRVGTVAQAAEEPDFVRKLDPGFEDQGMEISLYPKVEYTENAWGMAIDLNACNGCNACVTACQSENNIPIVGKEQVANGREMHWLRIDTYFDGDLDNPAVHHQPVMCMHCENAPCESVCPVAATLHDHEGLNVMVYNRCIGTRYCSNNCPYKVRRFNFLQFTDLEDESLKLQRNPNVTVRSRGVMEKCTYCVQRISAARITAKIEGRPIDDGEIVTACQGACPTRAISFGNINDPASEVAIRKSSPLNYGLLTDLNTHPRTTYLAKLRNPNPELEGATA